MSAKLFTPRPHPDRALTSIGLLVLRIGAGGLLLSGHGYPKLQRLTELAASFPDPLGVGHATSVGLVVFAEVVCASLVIIGLFTRLACIPILIFLCVAGFIHHAADPWSVREMAFVFMVPFLALFVMGGGRYALDAFVTRLIGRWPTG